MTQEKLRVAAYTRVSTNKEDQLNSLENQNTFFKEYAEKMGYELVNIYADEGVSGLKTKNRHQFNKLMEDARKGLFRLVLVKDISRMSRNTVDFLVSIRELSSLGVDTQFLTNNQKVIGQGEVTLGIMSIILQEESHNISKRTKWGKEQRSKQDGCIPTLVYGYNIVKTKDGNRKKSFLQINEQEAAVIRQIFELYTDQGCGAMKIAHMLNEKALTTKRGVKWTQTAVCRILKNELYIGNLYNGKQDTIDYISSKRRNREKDEWILHHYPELRIIEDEVFQKTQNILQNRNKDFKTSKTRYSNQYLFSTLLKCTCCGFSFRRCTSRYTGISTWICGGRNTYGKHSCSNATVLNENELIEAIKGYFASLISDREAFVQQVTKQFYKLLNMDKQQDQVLSRQDAEKELSKLEAKRERTVELYTEGTVGKVQFLKLLKPMDNDIKRLNNIIRSYSGGEKPDAVKNHIKQLLSSMESIINHVEITNVELKKVIDKIEVSGDGMINMVLAKIQ